MTQPWAIDPDVRNPDRDLDAARKLLDDNGWTDWDGDGRFDLLVNSANADLLNQVDAHDGIWVFRKAGAIAKQKNLK